MLPKMWKRQLTYDRCHLLERELWGCEYCFLNRPKHNGQDAIMATLSRANTDVVTGVKFSKICTNYFDFKLKQQSKMGVARAPDRRTVWEDTIFLYFITKNL